MAILLVVHRVLDHAKAQNFAWVAVFFERLICTNLNGALQSCSVELLAFGSLTFLIVCKDASHSRSRIPRQTGHMFKELIDTCIAISDHVKSLGTDANCDNKLPNQLTRSFRKVCQMLLVVKILYVSSG